MGLVAIKVKYITGLLLLLLKQTATAGGRLGHVLILQKNKTSSLWGNVRFYINKANEVLSEPTNCRFNGNAPADIGFNPFMPPEGAGLQRIG